MSERLDVLEEEIDSQQREIRQMGEQIPQALNPLIEENRQQLEQLQEKIQQLQNAQIKEEVKTITLSEFPRFFTFKRTIVFFVDCCYCL